MSEHQDNSARADEPRWEQSTDPVHDEGAGSFTDFGQFGYGRIDRRVLWQDLYWVDIIGTAHLLVDMPAAYIDNVIGYLRQRAQLWWIEDLGSATAEATDLLAHGAQPHELEVVVDRIRRMLALEPADWMESTPLMHRLLQLHDQHQQAPPSQR